MAVFGYYGRVWPCSLVYARMALLFVRLSPYIASYRLISHYIALYRLFSRSQIQIHLVLFCFGFSFQTFTSRIWQLVIDKWKKIRHVEDKERKEEKRLSNLLFVLSHYCGLLLGISCRKGLSYSILHSENQEREIFNLKFIQK